MRRLALLAFGVAGLVLVAAWILDLRATTIQKIRPFDEAAIEVNRMLFLPGDDVVAIYGTALGGPVDVVFLDEARILRPVEDPDLVLYRADETFVLQTRWIWYVARLVAAGAAGVGLLLLLLATVRRRVQRRAQPSS